MDSNSFLNYVLLHSERLEEQLCSKSNHVQSITSIIDQFSCFYFHLKLFMEIVTKMQFENTNSLT